jgi:hypothetical protein
MRGEEGDSGPNLKSPKPDSEPPSLDFLLPAATAPLFKVFFGRHRRLTPDFKASGHLDLQLRLSVA